VVVVIAVAEAVEEVVAEDPEAGEGEEVAVEVVVVEAPEAARV